MKEKLLISACLLGTPCRYDGKSVVCEKACLLSEKYELVPICPEVTGGLKTPRIPSERSGDRVINKEGGDVTRNFINGALEALKLAKEEGIKKALLKERSPSCGRGRIYDGSFSGKLVEGDGVAAELLMKNGISVYTESEIEKL